MQSHTRGGFTLVEAALVLALGAVALGMALPMTRAAADRWAVRVIRDAAVMSIHRSRAEARRRGHASLEILADSGLFRLRAADTVVWRWGQPLDRGVRIELPRGRLSDVLEFDARGLGIVTSRTVVFSRGRARARMVVSSRGRVSRP